MTVPAIHEHWRGWGEANMEPQRTGVADDLEAEVAAIAAEISDAGSALEALRLVAQTVCELERGRQAEGHGGPQAAQLEAMSYLIHTAQRHVKHAGEASERAEAVAAE